MTFALTGKRYKMLYDLISSQQERVIFSCQREGIDLRLIDPTRVVYTDVVLKKPFFILPKDASEDNSILSSYEVTEPFEICLGTSGLADVAKQVESADIVTFSPDKAGLTVQIKKGRYKEEFEIHYDEPYELSELVKKIPKVEAKTISVVMKSPFLADALNPSHFATMLKFGEDVEISLGGKEMTFMLHGAGGKRKMTFREGEAIEQIESKGVPEDTKAVVGLSYLVRSVPYACGFSVISKMEFGVKTPLIFTFSDVQAKIKQWIAQRS